MSGYASEKADTQTQAMTLKFEAPIVHGLDRYNDKLIIYLYNVSKYSDTLFKETFKDTFFEDAIIDLMPKIGLKLTVPVEQDALVYTYLGADGRSLKISVKQVKKKTQMPINPIIFNPPNISVHKSGKQSIVLDAGHGGSDTGAIGGGIYEKTITLDIAKRVEKILKQKGYDVKMTRVDDSTVSLQERVEISEEYDPDIFVSIHVNSSVKPEINGIETHYYHQESLPLAQTVHASFASSGK
jgi:N-acetylmuramoyl-L-alanine amidase